MLSFYYKSQKKFKIIKSWHLKMHVELLSEKNYLNY
jgi:hypothetical protein